MSFLQAGQTARKRHSHRERGRGDHRRCYEHLDRQAARQCPRSRQPAPRTRESRPAPQQYEDAAETRVVPGDESPAEKTPQPAEHKHGEDDDSQRISRVAQQHDEFLNQCNLNEDIADADAEEVEQKSLYASLREAACCQEPPAAAAG